MIVDFTPAACEDEEVFDKKVHIHHRKCLGVRPTWLLPCLETYGRAVGEEPSAMNFCLF